MAFSFGDLVRVRDPLGSDLTDVVRYLAGPGWEHTDDGTIWVCDEWEWSISEREFRDPRGTAWPAALVEPLR